MKVRATNTQVDPVYWAHLRKWPYGVAMEYDVSEKEYADILADGRLDVDQGAGFDAPKQAVISDDAHDDETPVEKRGPGRPRKGK